MTTVVREDSIHGKSFVKKYVIENTGVAAV